MNFSKIVFVFVFSIFLSGCFAGIPVVGPAVGTWTDDRVITGAAGTYGCAQLAESIDDTRLRRDVLRNCNRGVVERGRRTSQVHSCREQTTYNQGEVTNSRIVCDSSITRPDVSSGLESIFWQR